MTERPAGTVTLLFTDVEGSTRLLQGDEQRYLTILGAKRAILRAAVHQHGGQEVDATGDAIFAVFPRARDALAAALAAQRLLQQHPWPDGVTMRVRMGLHTGEPVLTDTGYVGMDVHKAARISASGYGGQILVSETTRALIDSDLPPGVTLIDLGEHRLKDLVHPVRLYQVAAPDLPSAFPLLRSATLHNNLPIPLTSFVGREREMAGVRARMAGARLLTLTGPGGCGKTRLAVHVAADVLDEYPDGVWFVEFAPLSDGALIPQAIAAALGLHPQSARSLLQTVAEYLQPRALLLVLDNCEHLVSSCAIVVETILRGCPHVRVLATSREPVGATGETTWLVPPLSTPDPDLAPDVAQLQQVESVRLFTERARGVVPSFTLEPSNAAAVARICRRLDGVPLAIELAAARVKVLSVEELDTRLDDRFRLLTGGSRTSMPRHQTLRATMDWSHDLLSTEERVLYRRLAVFAGSFTLAAAEAICPDDGVEVTAVLDILTRLVDRSLVMAELRGDTKRFRLLETIRQYALERLLAAGEAEQLRVRHRDWYLQRVEQLEEELHGPQQHALFDLLDTEHDNLRAAMDWSVSDPTSRESALRLAGALWWFWFVRGHLIEGRQRLEKALAGDDVRSAARAKALIGAAGLASLQGDYEPAAVFAEEGVAIYRERGVERDLSLGLTVLGYITARRGDYGAAVSSCREALMLARRARDAWGTAFALYGLGDVGVFLGDYRLARPSLEESLKISRSRGDAWYTGYSQLSLALVARHQGDFAFAEQLCRDAMALFQPHNRWGFAAALHTIALVHHAAGQYDLAAQENQEALELYRQLGNRSGVAYTKRGLALVALRRGELDQAEALCEESLKLFRELGDRRGMADALQTIGVVARARGEVARAAEAWQQSLDLFYEGGDRLGTVQCLRLLGEIAAARGELTRAVRLFGAMEGIAAPLEIHPGRHSRENHERHMHELRTKMSAEEFTGALDAGRAMTPAEAVRFARTGMGESA